MNKGDFKMNKSYKQIAEGVQLLCVNSDKFKTNCIKVDFYLPISDHLAGQNVMTSLMGHTSKAYDTFTAFNAKVESLYGCLLYTSPSPRD